MPLSVSLGTRDQRLRARQNHGHRNGKACLTGDRVTLHHTNLVETVRDVSSATLSPRSY